MEAVDLNSDQKSEGSGKVKATGSQSVSATVDFSTLEEKIDKVLKYQKTVRHVAIFRGVISFIFFLVFIVLPVIGSFYLFRFMQENIDLEKISGQYKEFYGTFADIKDKSSKIGNLDELIKKIPGNNE